MNLYEIENSIREVLDNGMVIDEETGEILWDEESLEELQLAREQKIESICLYIKNLDAEASAIHNEENALKSRRQSIEKKSDRLRNYIEDYLDGEKFSTSKCAVSFRRNKKVLVDEDHLPTEWWKAKLSPDKEAIKKALKNGEVIEGAILKDTVSMSIK